MNDFITEKEHDLLVEEVTRKLKKHKYEDAHFDSVITGYREAPISQWTTPENQAVIKRVLDIFAEESLTFLPVHALDLAAEGSIQHHVDNVNYSGGYIAGLSLLSGAVMRLRHDQHPAAVVEVLVKPRSLYIQRFGTCFSSSLLVGVFHTNFVE